MLKHPSDALEICVYRIPGSSFESFPRVCVVAIQVTRVRPQIPNMAPRRELRVAMTDLQAFYLLTRLGYNHADTEEALRLLPESSEHRC